MTDYLTNQLHFRTNSKTILAHIRSKNPAGDGPPLFSLNSIKPMPAPLDLPWSDSIKCLSLLNAEMPPLDETTKQVALTKLFHGKTGILSEENLLQRIEELRNSITKANLEDLEQAVSNYQQFKFFSSLDWRWHHWGTVADIHAVVATTFVLSTTYLEFTTYLTPPLPAMQILANTFPSVRFELRYRYHSQDTWTEVEFFPFPPFSY